MNPTRRSLRRRGVTLTELLVVIAIISLLSTIALPVYINQTEKARRGIALQETKELALAEERVASIHGFYVPLQLLDDLPPGTYPTGGAADTIGTESGVSVIDYTIPANILQSQGPISITSTDARVERLVANWEGPFMTFHRFYLGQSDDDPFDASNVHADFPLDPWGSPYRLYSPAGVAGTTVNDGDYTIADFNGSISGTARYDRWAVVSYGPNGEANESNPATLDDIVYLFGSTRAETTFNVTP